MLKQYEVLSRCIALINVPILPHVEKLKLEIQLILMKQLLLSQKVESMLKNISESEAEFQAIFDEIEMVCQAGDAAAARLTRVTARVKVMTDHLRDLLVPDAEPAPFPERPAAGPEARVGGS